MPVERLDEYDELVHLIYDASLRPERLQDVLERICGVLDSPFGTLFSWTREPGEGGFFFSTFPPGTVQRYLQLSSGDPHMKAARARGLLEAGVVVTNDELVPPKDLPGSEIYEEIWRPLGIGAMCGGTIFSSGDSHHLPTVVSVHRLSTAGPYSPGDRDLFTRLITHLSRALGVMFHLRDQQFKVAASLSALDQLTAGIVLIGDRGQIDFANRTARKLLDAGDLLSRRRFGSAMDLRLSLAGRMSQHDPLLRAAIADALRPLTADADSHFAKGLVLEDRAGKPACVIHVAPLVTSDAGFSFGPHARAIVFVYDLEAAWSLPTDLLMQSFSLTRAESRVALQIMEGGDVCAIAARLSVSFNTVKTHIRNIYAKTQVTQRADLLKLLLSLCAARP